MAAAKKGKIKELDGELMIMAMDYIKIFESGALMTEQNLNVRQNNKSK